MPSGVYPRRKRGVYGKHKSVLKRDNDQSATCNGCHVSFNAFAYKPGTKCPLCKGEDVDPSGF